MNLDFVSLITGAILAISGGAFVEWLKLKMQTKQELNFLKISFSDELEGIISIIGKLNEMWEKTGMVHKAYVNDLANNLNAYHDHRSRLFLFKDTELRRGIISFYKQLEELIKESEDKVGSLADTPEAKTEQERIKNKFCFLLTEAKQIKLKF